MRCEICGEDVSEMDAEHGNVAEMFDEKNNGPSMIVHAECGLAKGLTLS